MIYSVKEKVFSRSWIKSYIFIILGTFIMAAGFVLFISPYKLAPGGVYGIAIVLHHLFDFRIGLSGILMDIPLTLLAIRLLGPKFGIKTVIGFVLLALFITVFEFTWGYEPIVKDDALLSSIFGGVFLGLGLGLVFKAKASSGGTDNIAMILAKYTRLPLGQLVIIIDASIVFITLIAFDDIKIPMYSWIVIFITGKMVDVVLQGLSYDKTLFIISEKHEDIKEKILKELDRGGTYIQAKGMYSGDEKQMIFTVVSRKEVSILQDYIHEIDPNAFMTVVDAHEIYGHGFKSFNDQQHM